MKRKIWGVDARDYFSKLSRYDLIEWCITMHDLFEMYRDEQDEEE